jgi:hypothetical protein
LRRRRRNWRGRFSLGYFANWLYRRTVQVEPSSNGKRTKNGSGAQQRDWRKPALPPGSGTRRSDSSGRFLREKYDFPAMGTLRQVRQTLQAFMLGKHAFQEGVERIRFEVWSGM